MDDIIDWKHTNTFSVKSPPIRGLGPPTSVKGVHPVAKKIALWTSANMVSNASIPLEITTFSSANDK
jgi:hypothetical protein